MYLLMLAFIVISSVVLSGCASKVNLIDYVEVEFLGVEGQGLARPILDEEGLRNALAKAGKLDPGKPEDREAVDDYMSRISYELSPQKDLNNEDSVSLVVRMASSNNDLIQIIEGESHKKVEGLEEGEKINIFDYVDYLVTGVSPNASLELVNMGHDKFFKSLKFEIDKAENLSNGDQVEVKAKYDLVLAAESLYYIEKDVDTYVIEGADEYALEANTIRMVTEEGQKKSQEVLEKFIKEEIVKGDSSYDSRLEKIEILTIKDKEAVLSETNANALVFIYYIRSGSDDIYAAVYFNNLIKEKNKDINMDNHTPNVAIWGKDRSEIDKFVIEDSRPLYNIEEISFSKE